MDDEIAKFDRLLKRARRITPEESDRALRLIVDLSDAPKREKPRRVREKNMTKEIKA